MRCAPASAAGRVHVAKQGKHSVRVDLPVRGALPVPRTIMNWERELLLPIAAEALTDFVESNDHETPTIDKKRE